METKETFLPYGIITGLVLVVMNALFIAFDLELKTGMSILMYIPFIVGLIMNAVAFSKANNGYITYGKAYLSCFKATCVIAVIGAIWAAIAPFVFPDMIDKVLEVARQKLATSHMPEEMMDKAMKASRIVMKFSFIIVLIGDVFWGALISLIAAAVAKKKPYVPEAVSDTTFGGGAKY